MHSPEQVAHGGSIGRIIEELMAGGSGGFPAAETNYGYTNIDNTSVTSIMMYPNTEQMAAAGIAGHNDMEFMNRIDHLMQVDPRFGSRLGTFIEFGGKPNAGGIQPEHGAFFLGEYKQRKAEYEAMMKAKI